MRYRQGFLARMHSPLGPRNASTIAITKLISQVLIPIMLRFFYKAVARQIYYKHQSQIIGEDRVPLYTVLCTFDSQECIASATKSVDKIVGCYWRFDSQTVNHRRHHKERESSGASIYVSLKLILHFCRSTLTILCTFPPLEQSYSTYIVVFTSYRILFPSEHHSKYVVHSNWQHLLPSLPTSLSMQEHLPSSALH